MYVLLRVKEGGRDSLPRTVQPYRGTIFENRGLTGSGIENQIPYRCIPMRNTGPRHKLGRV